MITYLIENLWLVWLIVSFACLIIELSSGDLYVLCFAIGALVSLVADLLGLPLWAQVLVWAAASLLCIFFVRPPLVRKLHCGGEEKKSNADALIGREGRVLEAVPANGHGYVRIDGDEWRSVSADNTAIPVGSIVTVVSRDSIVLTVAVKS